MASAEVVVDKAAPSTASPSPTAPATTTTATDNKKLRLSCDNCHAAKVKCTKERPLCSRCANSGASCIYSKSRRAGKPKGCGKKNGPFGNNNNNNKLQNTPPEFCTRPESPLSDARMSMDFDDASWNVDIPGSRRDSVLDQSFTTLNSMAETTGSLNPTLTQTFTHSTMDTDDFSASAAFATDNMFAADFKMSPEWMSGMDAASAQVPFVPEGMTLSAANLMLYPEFSSDTSTLNDDASTSGIMTSPPPSCTCMGSLQDILSALNGAMPSFDKFLAINKSAVQRMAQCLACHCLPDISAVMLLSVIITRIVQCYKRIRNGECPGSEEVGVTMGSLKMDSEDEYQIKMVLIRSELRKIKALVTRFRERFESYLQGADRQLYEANMAFLEYGLDDTIKGL
ncbi:Fungal Zn2-Cys6 binuclear cluster domain-containing protein [Cladophialophora immunda]|nr:Fungal Zn2-Cys6 binuclear cluster domain-containing protein [Cladophialophora immunda]